MSSAADSAVGSAALFAMLLDANSFGKGSAKDWFTSQLWPSVEHIEHSLGFWETFAARPDPDGVWAFWKQWYQGMLDGTPMDWDLQLLVATEIDDEVWEEGAEAVAREVEKIRAAFDLRAAIASLEKQLGALATAPVYQPNQHNQHNGSEPLEDMVSIPLQQIALIEKKLGILKEQLARIEVPEEEPDPSIILRAAKALQDLAVEIAKYIVKTADVFVQTTTKK